MRRIGRHVVQLDHFELAPLLGCSMIPRCARHVSQAHALAGNTTTARTLLAQLAELAKTRHVPATTPAMIHAGRGEKEEALDWLEKGCAGH
jgi:hypothetical protein